MCICSILLSINHLRPPIGCESQLDLVHLVTANKRSRVFFSPLQKSIDASRKKSARPVLIINSLVCSKWNVRNTLWIMRFLQSRGSYTPNLGKNIFCIKFLEIREFLSNILWILVVVLACCNSLVLHTSTVWLEISFFTIISQENYERPAIDTQISIYIWLEKIVLPCLSQLRKTLWLQHGWTERAAIIAARPLHYLIPKHTQSKNQRHVHLKNEKNNSR